MVNQSKLYIAMRSHKVRKWALYALAFFFVVGFVGFFVLPPIVKSFVIDELAKALHRPVAIQRVSINPYRLSLSVDGVSIGEREGSGVEGQFVGFDSLHLNLESSSLFKGGIVVGEIRLLNPKVRVVRYADGRYNFSDLVDEAMAKPKSDEPTPHFSLNNLQLAGGEIEFDDRPAGERHRLSEIDFGLPFVSNMAYATEIFVEPSFSARINGAPFQMKGKSKPFGPTRESEFSLELKDVRVAEYLRYLPVKLAVAVRSGSVDTDLKLAYRQDKDDAPQLIVSGNVVLSGFKVADAAGAPLVAFKRLEVDLASADLLHRKFAVDRIKLASPEVYGRIGRSGETNWSALTAPSGTAAPKNAGKVAGKAAAPVAASAADKTPASRARAPEWRVRELSVERGALRWTDASRNDTLTTQIDDWSLDLKHLSSDPARPAELSTHFRLNGKGDIAVNGKLTAAPLNAELAIDAKAIELLPFQALFSDKLNVAITRGQLETRGTLQLRQAAGASSGALAGGFTGQATVGDFQAVDKANSADFLRWKSLYFGNVDVRLGPDSVSVGEIALTDFFARVIVSPQGKLNLLEIVRQGDAAKGAAPSTPVPEPVASGDGKAVAPVAPTDSARKATMPIQIGKVTLQGGSIRLTDNFVKPNYTANLRQVGGRIAGLSSEPGSMATLDLRGSYDNVAPLNIKARINPLSAKPYLDLTAEIKGVELVPFSSYSGKYAGYAIEKGKLSLSVNYKIENNELTAENHVYLDQLSFGDPVESAQATTLPVRLAVALLKNSDGVIDLNLPISGSLNDPQFSIGSIVVKVIVNVLSKAVTSPFALLGSIFGGGEEMSNIDFDAGRARLLPEAQKRLGQLAAALIDRPAVRLEIEGRVDPERDREGLKRASIDRKVRAAKREDLTKKGGGSGAADSVEVTVQEYPALLERVYRAEKFPKPRNMIGLVKSLPVEEMEKLMMANAVVDDDDLQALGDRRARAARDALVERRVPGERIFLLPTRVATETEGREGSGRGLGSRAEFSLK